MKSTMMLDTRPSAVYDKEQHRFIIKNISKGKITLPDVFRAIKKCQVQGIGRISWKFLAHFCQITQSDAFKVAYLSKGDGYIIRKALQPYLVIDDAENIAYFYAYDYKPESTAPTHVGPTITNGDTDTQIIVEKIPTKVSTRVRVKYPFNQVLHMKLQPTNGYLLGIRDIVVAQPDAVYEVSATAGTLTDLLQRLHFVAVEAGVASLLITVDDGSNEVGGVVSTTINIEATEGVKVSVPELHLPESPSATLLEESPFDPITVSDEDDKVMQFRITPFGCKIINFKNVLQPLMPGQVRNIYGRPETINGDIANLSIVPFQENAQIGVELICGNTTIRQYIVFDVTVPEVPIEEEPSEDTPPAPEAPESTPDADIPPQADEPEAQAAAMSLREPPAPEFTSTVEAVSGKSGEEVPLPVSLQGESDALASISIKPVRCSIFNPNTNQTTAHNTTFKLDGTVAEINGEISGLIVTIGTKDGRIDLTVNGTVVTIPVTVTADTEASA